MTTAERRMWIISYRFKDFYVSEAAWESDFKKFCADLKRFDSEHKQ